MVQYLVSQDSLTLYRIEYEIDHSEKISKVSFKTKVNYSFLKESLFDSVTIAVEALASNTLVTREKYIRILQGFNQ